MDTQTTGANQIPLYKLWPILNLDPCVVYGAAEGEECLLNRSQVEELERAWRLAQFQAMQWLGGEVPLLPITVCEVLPFRGCTGHHLAKRPLISVGKKLASERTWLEQPVEWWAIEDAEITKDGARWRVDVPRTLIRSTRYLRVFVNGSMRPLNFKSYEVETRATTWRVWFEDEVSRVDVAHTEVLFTRLYGFVVEADVTVRRSDGRETPVSWSIREPGGGNGEGFTRLAINRCYWRDEYCEPRIDPWDRDCFLDTANLTVEAFEDANVHLLAYPNCPTGLCTWDYITQSVDERCFVLEYPIECVTVLSHKWATIKPNVPPTPVCAQDILACQGCWTFEDLFCGGRPKWTHLQVGYVAGLVDGAYGLSEVMLLERLAGLAATFLDDDAGRCLQCGASGWVDRLNAYRRARDVMVKGDGKPPQSLMSGWLDAQSYMFYLRKLFGQRVTAVII